MVISHSSNHHGKTPSDDHFFQKIRWCGKIKTQGTLAEWLRSGLQNRVHQFNSGRCLHFFVADFYGQINALDIGDATHRVAIVTLLGATGTSSGTIKTKHASIPDQSRSLRQPHNYPPQGRFDSSQSSVIILGKMIDKFCLAASSTTGAQAQLYKYYFSMSNTKKQRVCAKNLTCSMAKICLICFLDVNLLKLS